MNNIRLNELQQKIVPILKSGVNALIQTHPGSGKTLCFALQSIEQKKSIIITPTKELSIQTYNVIRQLNPSLRVTRFGSIGLVAPIVELINDQEAKKSKNYINERLQTMQSSLIRTLDWKLIDLCITTPGQLAQILYGGAPAIEANLLVLDEADLLLGDPDFREIIKQIQRQLRLQQIIACSSVNNCFPEDIFQDKFNKLISKQYMQFPTQKLNFMNNDLENYLQDEQSIIFVHDRQHCQELNQRIPDSVYIHSDQTAEDRIYLIESFRSKKFKNLIATGLCSRGLDFPDVSQIIIYDLPDEYSTFLLQCGRLRKKNGQIIVNLKDSFESARFNEFVKYVYQYPKECKQV